MSKYFVRKCPFCGGSADILHPMQFVFVECEKCHATSAMVSVKCDDPVDKAVGMWNTRIGDNIPNQIKPVNVTVLPVMRIVHDINDDTIDKDELWDRIEQDIMKGSMSDDR